MAFPLRTRTRGRPGRNAGVTNVAATPAFNPLTSWTTAPIHGVWASDPAWTPPADGGAVSSWRNGGSVGGDFVQETGAKQPTYDAALAAYNNAAVVTFATDDVLAVAVADLPQPWWLVAVANVSAAGGVSQRIIGTGLTSRGMGRASGGGWFLGAGSNLIGSASNANPHLLVGAANGASSSMLVDGASVGAGAAGAEAVTDLSLGADNAGVGTHASFLDGSIAYAAVFTTDPTGQAEWADFVTWAETTYGLTVA